ncbi:MAG TPA: metal ABC transporter permease [Frankiaceae bacterium]|nr:metal ABC transporter permease [Frankiaceae bacterium]
MTTVLSLEFMRRALIAAALVGLTAPAIGTFLVQRRLALMGDGIGHVALTGVGLALLAGTAPLPTAVVLAVAGAVAIELLRERGGATGDVALALLFYGGIAGGVLLTNVSRVATTTNLVSYLFGSVSTVTAGDLGVIAGLALLVLGVVAAFGRELFSVCYDEEVARASGLPVRLLNLLIAVTAALTVALAMRVVGLLLVSALMVVPVAAAQQVARSFKGTLLGSLVVGVTVSVGGLLGAYYVDAAPGAVIVLLAIAGFVGTSVWARVTR